MHPPRSTAALAAATLAALALCACGGKGPTSNDNPPAPPDVAANFVQPINAEAADGSWSLKIRDNQLTLSRPGQPDVTATAPGASIQPHQATWTAPLADKRPMTVKIYASSCVYPATVETHAFAAEVDMPDDSPLSGCADPVTAPKPAAKPAAPAKR
ncbi:hypothetical protein [Phenylobacterium sp.]|jgi:uncharacterized membrane protein|uniref:hypothetical protein n=1 Tax=Phenylobacterium sp. TaxID=1871053 RepID=UPI002F41D2E3